MYFTYFTCGPIAPAAASASTTRREGGRDVSPDEGSILYEHDPRPLGGDGFTFGFTYLLRRGIVPSPNSPLSQAGE